MDSSTSLFSALRRLGTMQKCQSKTILKVSPPHHYAPSYNLSPKCGHAHVNIWLLPSSNSKEAHLNLIIQAVMQNQVIGQGDAVRLHGVVKSIVERSNVWVVEICHLNRL